MAEKSENAHKPESQKQFDFNTPLSESSSPQEDQEDSETEMDDEVKEQPPFQR